MSFAHTWITSDLHLLHERVADIRGFDSVEDHDEWIYSELEKLHSGRLIIAGDLTIGRHRDEDQALAVLGEMFRRNNVTVDYVPGNHCSCHPMSSKAHKRIGRFNAVFRSVMPMMSLKLGEHRFLVSHFPYNDDPNDVRCSQWKLPNKGKWLLHGHTHHESAYFQGRQIHIGIDAWGGPVSADEILAIVQQAERSGDADLATWDYGGRMVFDDDDEEYVA